MSLTCVATVSQQNWLQAFSFELVKKWLRAGTQRRPLSNVGGDPPRFVADERLAPDVSGQSLRATIRVYGKGAFFLAPVHSAETWVHQ